MLFFPWVGDRAVNALMLECRRREIEAGQEGPALRLGGARVKQVRSLLGDIAEDGVSDPVELAAVLGNKTLEKHHRFLRDELLEADYASRHLDPGEAADAVRALSGGDGSAPGDGPEVGSRYGRVDEERR